MLFTIKERLMLQQILPSAGDITTLRIVRKLQNDISFSEEEHADLKFKHCRIENGARVEDPQGPMLQWDENSPSAKPKEIEIGDKAKEVIAGAFRELIESKQKVDFGFLELCDRFVDEN